MSRPSDFGAESARNIRLAMHSLVDAVFSILREKRSFGNDLTGAQEYTDHCVRKREETQEAAELVEKWMQYCGIERFELSERGDGPVEWCSAPVYFWIHIDGLGERNLVVGNTTDRFSTDWDKTAQYWRRRKHYDGQV